MVLSINEWVAETIQYSCRVADILPGWRAALWYSVRMHSAQGHTVTDERWRLELALAALCRSLAPRPSETLLDARMSAAAAADAADAGGESARYCSYYSYRYL